jgi:hypothetical protein
MQAIGEILPTVIENMSNKRIDFIKRKAAEYADICISDGQAFAAAYKKDYDSGLFTDGEAVTVVKLTDVYTAVKSGIYSRIQGAEKQKEILELLKKTQSNPD